MIELLSSQTRNLEMLLGPGDIHVWILSLDYMNEDIEFLDDEELKRVGRFSSQTDTRRFALTHGALRRILSTYLEIEPQSITYSYGLYGKPRLAKRTPGYHLCFNMSHSCSKAAIAVANGIEVGIDIERIREDVPVMELADYVFSSNDQEEFLNDHNNTDSFFKHWTRKEAYVKATGKGLSAPLKSIPSFRTDEKKYMGQDQDGRWSIIDIGPIQGYACALAVLGDIGRVAIFNWPA